MDRMEADTLLRKLDRRMQDVEQILPTLPTREQMREAIDLAVRPLATKEDLGAAVAQLASKEELAAAIAPLATKDEAVMRSHFDAVTESLRDDVRLVAGNQVTLQTAVNQEAQWTRGRFDTMQSEIREQAQRTRDRFDTMQSEIREDAQRTRDRFEAVAESLRDDIRLIAESQVALQSEVRQGRDDLHGILKNHEQRIVRLEASAVRKRKAR